MHPALRRITYLGNVIDVTNDTERRIIANVAIDRKLMSCEVVSEQGGFIIKLLDCWINGDDDNLYMASDWKFADVPCENSNDGPKVEAVWIKQKKNYLINIASRINNSITNTSDDALCELYPMVRIPVKIIIGEESCMIQYFGKKQIEKTEFDMPNINQLLKDNDLVLGECAVEVLNTVCSHFEISEHVANEIR